MTRWAILTGEYPPQRGGVSDYTRLVARGLVAAGDTVRVFAPRSGDDSDTDDPGVEIHRLPGRFGPRSLMVLETRLEEQRVDRILVQYVPHAFGWKAMNVPFALWLAARAGRFAPVSLMFHEVAFPFRRWPLSHALLGSVTPVMARIAAGTAERVFVSIPAWGPLLKSRIPAEWLPVPCTIDANPAPEVVALVRNRVRVPGVPLVGHFGTCGEIIAAMLVPALVELLCSSDARVLLIGRGSREFRARLDARHPEFAQRVSATGELADADVSAHLRACDLLLQPYPDGISSRRTSAMAGLANGVPVATNLGALSEPLWSQGAVAGPPIPDAVALALCAAALLADRTALEELGRRGAALYRETFALEQTIAKLRSGA